MPTEQQILSEEQIAEIEARHKLASRAFHSYLEVTDSLSDIPALCQTVRALLQEQREGEMCEFCDEMSNLPDGSPRTFLVCGACWNENVEANRVTITRLRDELAEVTKERDDLRDELEKIKGAGVP